ncbi:hypothetical protein EV199_5955 [Pseudobacter ginsenosidimutans]|uniref:Outer membrane protein with beta-barrel domain n=3 Tax=Pseudobacter ginsenosidimutans TaxID=661488 RepID=A0A4Q7MDY1_9BACT|nr:hypothetical protein EV199_5955 [Pseudobacter ginsenosidimutans]
MIITILVLSGIAGLAQTEQEAAATDSTPPEKSTFTIGAQYATNASYYGQKAIEKTPYVALVASYNHRSGFYVNSMAYRLLKDSSRLASAYAAGAGFTFNISKSLEADIGYTYTFFPKLSPFLQAANPHNASATLTLEKWITAAAAFDFTFGKTNDIFVTPAISKQIRLIDIDSNSMILFTPEINVTAGTQRFYEYYQEDKKTRDSILGKVFERLPVDLPIPGNPNRPDNPPTTIMKSSSSFDLLSYNLKLPVAYYRPHCLFELSCLFSLLGQKVETDPGKLNTFFTASFYYQF